MIRLRRAVSLAALSGALLAPCSAILAQTVLPASAHDGNVGPLQAGTVYFATGTVTVPSGRTLTVEAGAVIAFDATGALLDVLGTLDVNGQNNSPAVFTSACDTAVVHVALPPGFTCQGAAAAGDWAGIHFATSSDASVLEHAIVRYAGTAGAAAVDLTGASITLANCAITDCAGAAIDAGGSRFVLTDSLLTRCQRAVLDVPLVTVPAWQANTATLIARGSAIWLDNSQVDTPTSIGPDNTLNQNGVLVATRSITVQLGNRLLLDAGIVCKLFGPGVTLTGNGPIVTSGTAVLPVVFTSLRDDQYGGDTENDGPTSGTPGDWGQLRLVQTVGTLNNTFVRYGGRAGGGGEQPAVALVTAPSTLTSCWVQHSLGRALQTSLAAEPTVTGCHFDYNGMPPIDVQLRAVPGFRNNTAGQNAGGSYMRIYDPVIPAGGSVTIYPFNYPGAALVADATLTVAGGRALTLEAGVVLKFDGQHRLHATGGRLDLRGTGTEPVVVTSLVDDEFGNDTNGDGGATTPARGDWSKVEFNASSVLCTIEHAIVRYAGNNFNAPFRINAGATVSARYVRVEHCVNNGFLVDAHVGDAIGWVAYDNSGQGIRVNDGAFDLVHCTSVGNGLYGIRDGGTYTGNVVSSISWGNGTANYYGFGVGRLTTSNGSAAHVGSQGNIDLDPKFIDAANGNLDLQDDSPCAGTAHFGVGLAVRTDFRESPRVLDHELNGVAMPDMGAYERAPYLLHVDGEARLGSTITLNTSGAPGLGVLLIGDGAGDFFFGPYGIVLAGALPTVVVGPTLLAGQPISLQVPNNPSLDGVHLAFQAMMFSLLDPTRGGLTNQWRFRIFE